LKDQELMPEGKNLGLQRDPSSKGLRNRSKQQGYDRGHGIGKLLQRPFKFNWLNKNEVFGRDNFNVS